MSKYPESVHVIVCLMCGKSFTAERTDAKFCTGACRARHSRLTRAGIEVKPKKKRGRPRKNLGPEVKIEVKPGVKPKKKPGWPKGKKRGPRKRSTHRAEKATLITALPVVGKIEIQPEVIPEVKEIVVEKPAQADESIFESYGSEQMFCDRCSEMVTPGIVRITSNLRDFRCLVCGRVLKAEKI